jgi:ABC-type multidrug transport system ATPase subunit
MELILENLGKKYEGNWIFRNVNLSLPSGSRLLITGKNGSGKSTLAKTIAGLILPSEGKIQYKIQ